MSGTEFTIDHNTPEIAQLLNELLERAADLSPAMGEIAGFMDMQARERFDTATDPDGNPWAELSERTQATKAKGGYSIARALHGETLHLRDTLHFSHDSTSATLSTGQPAAAYAATHQFGNEGDNINVPAHQRIITQAFGKELDAPVTVNVKAFSFTGNTPARPYLGLGEDDQGYVVGILGDFLAGMS